MWCSGVGGFYHARLLTAVCVWVCLFVAGVTFSVPYLNTFSEARKQLSVPFVTQKNMSTLGERGAPFSGTDALSRTGA